MKGAIGLAKIEKTKLNEDDQKLTNEQTYDSALGAMVTKLREYIVPLVNEAFGEKFTGNAEITLRNNKHVIRRTDDSLDRRDSDMVVELTEMLGEFVKKVYMFECETWYDKTIVFRIAEYSSSFAIETAKITNNGVVLKIPYSAVIFLHPNGSIPEVMKITYEFPNGKKVSYGVPTLQIKDYTVDELFKKKLLILLPFYLFKFANEFEEMEENAERRQAVNETLKDINRRLEALMSENGIDAYQKMTIQSLLKRVSDRLVAQYENLKREVDEIMSGAIARTQADDILEEGQQQGREQQLDNVMALFSFLYNNGRTEDVQKATKDAGLLKKLMADFINGNLKETNS
ncbi:MAG: hypothetical protein IJ719_00230 [Clostridia bacterium]|nr:hypothetical protein [Clostridia bacterium]